MEKRDLQHLFERVAAGEVSPADAIAHVQTEPFRDYLGYAKIDTQRGISQGVSRGGVRGRKKRRANCRNHTGAFVRPASAVLWRRVSIAPKPTRLRRCFAERDAAEFVYYEDAEMVVVGERLPTFLMATDMWWLLPQAQATCAFRKKQP